MDVVVYTILVHIMIQIYIILMMLSHTKQIQGLVNGIIDGFVAAGPVKRVLLDIFAQQVYLYHLNVLWVHTKQNQGLVFVYPVNVPLIHF